jgi:hypothetical protein
MCDDEEESCLPAGTIYSQNSDTLLAGLPSEGSYLRSISNRWLLRDETNYQGKGLYAGRGHDMVTATCHPRRFVATPLKSEASADTGNETKEDGLITAENYHPDL